jgi:hypothetical protein
MAEELSCAERIERVRHGDQEAATTLVRRYGASLAEGGAHPID